MNFHRPSLRTSLWTAGSFVVALILGVVVGKYALIRSSKNPPAAYLIPTDDTTRVKLRWKSRTLSVPLTLTANAKVTLPLGKKARLVYPDGRQDTLTGPTQIRIPAPPTSELDFLSASVHQLRAKPLADVHPTVEGAIHITSPVGVTRFTDPVISWIADPKSTYDIAIVDLADEAAPPRILRGVHPPVQVSALESKQGPQLRADRIFTVLIRRVDDISAFGTNRFLTAPEAEGGKFPSEPADLMMEAVTALTRKPSRTGDAWEALSRLPSIWKSSDLARRLRLKVAAELGLEAEAENLKRELGRDQ